MPCNRAWFTPCGPERTPAPKRGRRRWPARFIRPTPGKSPLPSNFVEERVGAGTANASWAAAMAPHAGLRFSGKVAGAVFRRLAIPSTVIIIGPKHTPHGMDWAVAPCKQWTIPGAKIDADPALAKRLTEAVPGLELDAAAHQQEHAIEVELPFLARLAPQARVVGIALGQTSYAECLEFRGRICQGAA